MVYDFEVFPLELELLVGKSSFVSIYRTETIRQPLIVARTVLFHNRSTISFIIQRIARLTPFIPLPQPKLLGNVSEVSICRIIECIIPNIEYTRESRRDSKWSRKRARAIFGECKWSVDEFIMEESVRIRGQAAGSFVRRPFFAAVRANNSARFSSAIAGDVTRHTKVENATRRILVIRHLIREHRRMWLLKLQRRVTSGARTSSR